MHGCRATVGRTGRVQKLWREAWPEGLLWEVEEEMDVARGKEGMECWLGERCAANNLS